MRGSPSRTGEERIAQNGYAYIKTDDGWRLKHHVIAEEKYNRHIDKDVTVRFVDGDRTNFEPDNIILKSKFQGKKDQRKEVLKRRIRELQAELDFLEGEES